MKNTTDQVNIELSCTRDTDLSRFWFDETFKVLQYSSYRENSILVYGAHLVDVSDFDLSDHENYNIKSSKELILACLKADNLTGYEEIRDCLHYIGTTSDTLYDVMLGGTEYLGHDSIEEFLKDNFEPKFVTLESRGYSQGDYSEVIIPASVLKEFPDHTLETIGSFLQEEIDHLLWDAPVSCRVEIDNTELYLEDLLSDRYEWDKEDAIALFKTGMDRALNKLQYKTLISFLRENLTDYPEYQH